VQRRLFCVIEIQRTIREKTRRTADEESLRAEIVKSGCSPESRKFPAFYNAAIFRRMREVSFSTE